MKLTLQELTLSQQQLAFEKGSIDTGFTRTAEQSKRFASRSLYSDPMLAVLPRSMQVNTKQVRISDPANDSFVLFQREGSPGLLATIFYRLKPDEVRMEPVATWKKESPSVVLRAFLDLVDAKASWIQKKAKIPETV